MDTDLVILEQMNAAVEKAWDALAGYKFWMFGYHASQWVKMNQLLPREMRMPNPFREAVKLARGIKPTKWSKKRG